MNTILIIVSLAALAFALFAQWQIHSLRRTLQQLRPLEGDLRTVRDDIGALCSGAAGVGSRLTRLEQRLRNQGERQDQLDLRTSGERPYQQAGRLVHNGAGIEELMESCGLTRGEAELIYIMNSAPQASNG